MSNCEGCCYRDKDFEKKLWGCRQPNHCSRQFVDRYEPTECNHRWTCDFCEATLVAPLPENMKECKIFTKEELRRPAGKDTLDNHLSASPPKPELPEKLGLDAGHIETRVVVNALIGYLASKPWSGGKECQ